MSDKSKDLLARIRKASVSKNAEILSKSGVFGKGEIIKTPVPMFNVAMNGDPFGGFSHGVTLFAGPSRHFKSLFCLLAAAAFLEKHPDGVIIFYDSEFGTTPEYFANAGIDPDRVVHCPITNIEQFTFDIVAQIKEITVDDNVMIITDSIGNLASKKAVTDAEDQKSSTDMTRAKVLKQLFQIITPEINLKKIPFFAVNHTYNTLEMFSKQVMSGGQGPMLSADNVFFIGRQQDKDGKELQGYHFIINVEKSRFIKEKSKIPISVSHEDGILKWSGLFEVALEGGFITSPSKGWYEAVNPDTGEVLSDNKMRRTDMSGNEFWKMMFKKTNIAEFIRQKYQLSHRKLIADRETLEDAIEDAGLDQESVDSEEVQDS